MEEEKKDIWNLPVRWGKKFMNYIHEKTADRQEASYREEQESVVEDDQFVYTRFEENMKTLILQKLKEINNKPATYSTRKLFICINKEELFELAVQNNLDSLIADYIDDKAGKLQAVELRQGTAPAGTMQKMVSNEVQIALCNPENFKERVMPEKKKIGVMKMLYDSSECMLLNEPVLLEPEEGKIWYIGWGAEVEINNRPRKNHIALAYKEPEKHNAEVYMISRAHAHIKYREGYYYLYVERGLRENDERTKIERGGRIIELSDKTTGRPLRDRDIIRLNNEYLIFTLEEEKKYKKVANRTTSHDSH